MIKVLAIAPLLLLFAGCAGVQTVVTTGDNHPASADAPATSLPRLTDLQAARTPAAHESDSFTDTDPVQRDSMDHSAHQSPPATDPSSALDDASGNSYVCPMHADVTSSEPAKCPKCGMKLVKKGDQ